MKLYLCLLSLLSIVIMAFPTMALHRSTSIETIEKRAADLDVVEGKYEARGINVGLEGVEPRHLLGKRSSPICSEACGKADASDCLATLAVAANAGKLSPDIAFCARNSEVSFFGGNCIISFSGTTGTTCISNKRLAGLAQEVFNDCINDPNVATGGCFVLEDTGHVCLGNQKNIQSCVLV
jgi:hypothetical protein